MPGYAGGYTVSMLKSLSDVRFTGTPSQGSVPAWHAASSAFLDSVREWAIATAITTGIALRNTTAATSGATVQNSPALNFLCGVWDTDGTPRTEEWWVFANPTSAAAPYSGLAFYSRQDAAAAALRMIVYSTGALSVTSVSANTVAGTIRANGDAGGAASNTTFTNATVAAAAGSVTWNNAPTGYSTTISYIKAYVGTSACVIPVLLAA